MLRPHGTLRGRVVAADGNPLPQAWIEVVPFDASGVLDAPAAQPHATDAAGRFEVSLPRTIQTVDLAVMAPGHPLTQGRVALEDLGDLQLGSAAGTLVLDLPDRVDAIPWVAADRPRPGLIGPQGLKLPLGLLGQWSSLNGHLWEPTATQVTLPLLAPGRYAVCWVPETAWLLRASNPTACTTGEVRPGETVVLALPPVASRG